MINQKDSRCNPNPDKPESQEDNKLPARMNPCPTNGRRAFAGLFGGNDQAELGFIELSSMTKTRLRRIPSNRLLALLNISLYFIGLYEKCNL